MYRKRSYKYGTPFLDIILTVQNVADTEYKKFYALSLLTNTELSAHL